MVKASARRQVEPYGRGPRPVQVRQPQTNVVEDEPVPGLIRAGQFSEGRAVGPLTLEVVRSPVEGVGHLTVSNDLDAVDPAWGSRLDPNVPLTRESASAYTAVRADCSIRKDESRRLAGLPSWPSLPAVKPSL